MQKKITIAHDPCQKGWKLALLLYRQLSFQNKHSFSRRNGLSPMLIYFYRRNEIGSGCITHIFENSTKHKANKQWMTHYVNKTLNIKIHCTQISWLNLCILIFFYNISQHKVTAKYPLHSKSRSVIEHRLHIRTFCLINFQFEGKWTFPACLDHFFSWESCKQKSEGIGTQLYFNKTTYDMGCLWWVGEVESWKRAFNHRWTCIENF